MFTAVKIDNFLDNFQTENVIFFFFSHNIDNGYSIELPHFGSFNKYLQSVF